uniref:Uncharacterized protein n=1 Tax=Romanomermis culicivorax TaxID=13658 RepID=A0A915KYJ6_ROMCU
MDRQKKNKDPVVKAIHFDAYPVIGNIDISPPLYELAERIGFFPEKRTLKAIISTMWALDVSKLTLRFPAALRFFNNLSTWFLQSDVLAYAALDAYYLLLLFLAFGHYGFIPEGLQCTSLVSPQLVRHCRNQPPCRDNHCRFSQRCIVRCSTHRLCCSNLSHYLASRPPPIMGDEVLSTYKFFINDCTSTDHGRSFCLGMVPNGFCNVKVLRRTTHPKLLIAPKVPKKKKKKQKDEWNKSPDISDDEDPALKP